MEMLISILKEIDSGTTAFKPKTGNEQDMLDFQVIAKTLIYAKKEGLIDHYYAHPESETGNDWYDLVSIKGGLTDKGKMLIRSQNQEL